MATTQRLILTEFAQEDAEGFFAMNQNSQVLQYTGDEPFASLQACRDFLQQYAHYQHHQFGRWTLRDKATKEYLGFCGLKFSESNGETDLGFRVVHHRWNEGIATEAAMQCLQLGFSRYQLSTIVGRAHHANLASIHLLKKLGFRYSHHFFDKGDEWHQYILSAEDYLEGKVLAAK
ncbi:GNAT family N-acetyltransferase [Pleionea sp. CnH1-48]|uniref:GNAT family N-acetyltransferase n=1 Tax=Pleionea sp. CnH1-48 TaxID=2954494 RepID=UPI00209826AA|nr:GNAT family N-acetyltransferase [Pleionea sp. CnH1-48]